MHSTMSIARVCAIVLLVGAILIVIRGTILAPLARITTRYGDLARGDRDRAIEDPDALPEEMRDLARHHEALRSKGDPE